MYDPRTWLAYDGVGIMIPLYTLFIYVYCAWPSAIALSLVMSLRNLFISFSARYKRIQVIYPAMGSCCLDLQDIVFLRVAVETQAAGIESSSTKTSGIMLFSSEIVCKVIANQTLNGAMILDLIQACRSQHPNLS